MPHLLRFAFFIGERQQQDRSSWPGVFWIAIVSLRRRMILMSASRFSRSEQCGPSAPPPSFFSSKLAPQICSFLPYVCYCC
jgi:hypothetical protein